MSRPALLLMFLFTQALAHSGHDAPTPHVHAGWEAVMLLALIAACAIFWAVRRRSHRRRGRRDRAAY